MSTTTTRLGLPIPADSDPVANGAAAMRDLGNDIDLKIRRGSAVVAFNASGLGTLTHSIGTAPAAIMCWAVAGSAATALLIAPTAAPGTNTVALAARNGASAYAGGNLTIYWIAIV